MHKFKGRVSPILLILIICILGFITGIFTIVLWQENWLITDGILNQEFMYKIEDVIIDKRALFFLCLEKRLGAFFLLFLLTFSTINIWINVGIFFLKGLYIGSVIELMTIRYGMKGIFMYMSFVFPQGIFYLMGYVILGCWCIKQEKTIDGEQRSKKDKIQKVRDTGQLLAALIWVLVGVILESYVNIYFLKIFF